MFRFTFDFTFDVSDTIPACSAISARNRSPIAMRGVTRPKRAVYRAGSQLPQP
ncbi:hypothetical protein GZL_02236 [Streptomyces sp. 769]|nr:hypothetical protein GZL_02236 [Streptomyces sp. 769]